MDNILYDEGESVEISAAGDDAIVGDSSECREINQLGLKEGNRKRLIMREDTSSDEGWHTISRRQKVIRRSNIEVEEQVQVIVSCSSALPKQFALARLFQTNEINGISQVKYVHQFKILITFDQETHADRFIECKAFQDLGWRSQKTSEVAVSYGVIKDIDLNVAEEDILKSLSGDVEIVAVKRLNKRNLDDPAPGWVKCEAIRLGFKGNSLPKHVYIHGMRINVVPYIFPVTQCSRCWKFGHTRLLCPSKKVVCPKCTKNHENCDIMSYRCVNCTGNHMSLQKICPIFKKERRIRELMSEFNCTYRKAQSMYVPPSPAPDRCISPGPPLVQEQNPDPLQLEPDAVCEGNIDLPRTQLLMSQLFNTPEQSSVKMSQSRKQKKLRKLPPPTPLPERAPSPSPPSMDWSKESESSEDYTNKSSENRKKSHTNYNTKDLSFTQLLSKLYKIVVDRISLENKIRQIVTISTEWILAKVVSGISVSSLLSIFANNG